MVLPQIFYLTDNNYTLNIFFQKIQKDDQKLKRVVK